MFIVIKKKSGTNQWHYPYEPKKFTQGFLNPINNQEFVVKNNSGKTLAELTAAAGYDIVEYTGDNPITETKKVGMSELGELLPESVIVELEDFRNDKTQSKAIREGASTILRRIYSNVKIDVMEKSFVTLLTDLVAFTSLTNPQAVSIYTTLRS